MGIQILEVDVRANLPLFQGLLNRNRTKEVGIERFEWLYLKNPQGSAKAWIVKDEKSERAVAFTSVLPRLVSVDTELVTCWNCSDFSVDPAFRSLGVAVRLRRKAKDCVDNGQIRALYAHPNDRMRVIHERVGHQPIGKMQRYVKVLQWEPEVRKYVRSTLLERVVGGSLTRFFRTSETIFSSSKKGFMLESSNGEPFGEEYDRLFHAAIRWYRVIGDRTSSYLNWRYGQNPLYRAERMVIRKDGELLGYVIYLLERERAVFQDILCVPEEEIVKVLVEHWIGDLRGRGIQTISAILMSHNPIIPLFKKLGFKSRPEESFVFAYTRSGDRIDPAWLNGGHWYMTVGDRDV